MVKFLLRACPNCTNKMTTVEVSAPDSPVELDFCFTCHSMWFDDGEIKRLPKKTVKEKEKNLADQLAADKLKLNKFYSDFEKQNNSRVQGWDTLIMLDK